MLLNTGQHASRAVHQVGLWMPTVVTSQEETAKIFLKELNWQIKMWNMTAEVLTNISVALNWMVCNVQMMHAHIQQERFKRVVTTGNFHEWRQLWNISSKSWLQLEPQKTYCNATMCEGHWTQIDVINSTTVCHYYILPVVTVQGYWFLKLDGDWFGPQTNYTHDLDLCETADKGMVCMLQQGDLNPCLTGDEVLCDWTHEPARETIKSHPQLPQVPFVGCFDVYIWSWNNVTYQLTNFTISLDWFKCALNQSTELNCLVKSHRSNISSLKVSTFMAQGQVLHAAKLIEQSSAHHWWDIFNGMSVTARNYVVPPLLLLIIVIIVLTSCNV
ncbi:uncharacterized protein LOC118563103 [Fundulus heteroclitus]|uniref:uncharacterized protein LOC118563103 n=1 Tax=Fundulus heteroclitus TaxID=8078 RepID=UPI00165B0DF9|nr:uncharacterized protein LOC118563103 [Fundulus heteroclitus]XP_035992704.1 uncharacterized protein LOC118563103 [Fundulus heteroclitus]